MINESNEAYVREYVRNKIKNSLIKEEIIKEHTKIFCENIANIHSEMSKNGHTRKEINVEISNFIHEVVAADSDGGFLKGLGNLGSALMPNVITGAFKAAKEELSKEILTFLDFGDDSLMARAVVNAIGNLRFLQITSYIPGLADEGEACRNLTDLLIVAMGEAIVEEEFLERISELIFGKDYFGSAAGGAAGPIARETLTTSLVNATEEFRQPMTEYVCENLDLGKIFEKITSYI